MTDAQRAEEAHRKLVEAYDLVYRIGSILDRHPTVERVLDKLAAADFALDGVRMGLVQPQEKRNGE